MVTLQGVVTEVTFRSEDTGFSVVRVSAGDGKPAAICVGVMPSLQPGESATLRGQWQNHARFGPQLSVESYEIIRPTTEKAILAMLGSGLIANIGETRAKRIVEKFGVETLDVLDSSPDRLREVAGIGPKLLGRIKESWDRQRSIRDLMLFLREFGVSVNLATKIHNTYGSKARDTIQANPYALINDIWGVGFKKADAIAQKLGYDHDSARRAHAGITYVLQESMGDGHLYLPRKELLDKAVETLGVTSDAVALSLDQMTQARDIIDEDGSVYLPVAHAAERSVAELLHARIEAGSSTTSTPDRDDIDKWLSGYAIRTGWKGDAKQVDAVKSAVRCPIFMLTGGPGTGKTTTLQVIVSYFREHNVAVSLAAPTGRAAQRMGSIAGLAAQTIHRLLEFKPGTGGFRFTRNANNPLQTGVLIVDEVSMIDVFLMRSLLLALKLDTSLVLVGDNNQLPSVGPGNILADLIASRAIPHVHLTTIFRQAAQSTIVRAAHQIIGGAVPSFVNDKADNCFFLKEEDPDRCLAALVDVVASRLPKSYGLDPIVDIQVLTPMHKGVLGTQNINRQLQGVLNPGARKMQRGDVSFAVGDKVMQIRNNYDAGVFNGDIGFVADIGEDGTLQVDFDGQKVAYDGKRLDELTHAYCISIHKSQGCEFRAVVIPLMTQHFIMLQRNLVYTALTRAREICVFVGMPGALSIAVNNNEAFHRNSRLAQRICAGGTPPAQMRFGPAAATVR